MPIVKFFFFSLCVRDGIPKVVTWLAAIFLFSTHIHSYSQNIRIILWLDSIKTTFKVIHSHSV